MAYRRLLQTSRLGLIRSLSWAMRLSRRMLTCCRSKLPPCFWWRHWWARSTLRSIGNKEAYMVPLSWYLIFAALLFSIGLFGVLSRRNAVAILLVIELMLISKQNSNRVPPGKDAEQPN